eukprot:3913403-Rhodomonas_salina.2
MPGTGSVRRHILHRNVWCCTGDEPPVRLVGHGHSTVKASRSIPARLGAITTAHRDTSTRVALLRSLGLSSLQIKKVVPQRKSGEPRKLSIRI